MNEYLITLDIHVSQGKVKIDYGLIPVELVENSPKHNKPNYAWHSLVADEFFVGFKKKKIGWVQITKGKKQIVYRAIITNQNEDMELAEKEILPLASKDFCKYLFFRPKFKNKLKNRSKLILL